MSASVDQFPSLGYARFDSRVAANSVVAGTRCLTPFVAASVVMAGAFAPTGIDEFVTQCVIARVAYLSPSLRQRIAELSALEPNWDGERAKAIKSHVLADVTEVLTRFSHRSDAFREPFLVPTFDGFAQMEWHDKKRSLEIEAVAQGWSLVGTAIGSDGERNYYTAECERSDFQTLETAYDWFVGVELIWPSL